MANTASEPGTAVWSGEHWIGYLRRPDEEQNSGSVSLYHTRYSPAGEGNVAFVGIPGEGGFTAMCTDNREVAEFVTDTVVRWDVSPFQRDIQVLDSKIERGGDVRRSPSWVIDAGQHKVVATWSAIEPPVTMNRPLPSDGGHAVTHSLLFFTDEATITLDGRPVRGTPYIRDAWRRAIGRPASSCCFALSETMLAGE